MDILLNAANAALLLAHGMRADVEAGLLLLGPPDPPRLVRLLGDRLRSFQPDIRSNAALLRRALEHASRIERETSPGVIASRATFAEALDRLGPAFVYLREGGRDIRLADVPADATFVRSDNTDLDASEERVLADRVALTIGLGPRAIHTDHAITLLHNELDRRLS